MGESIQRVKLGGAYAALQALGIAADIGVRHRQRRMQGREVGIRIPNPLTATGIALPGSLHISARALSA